jgi:hypothetical protein
MMNNDLKLTPAKLTGQFDFIKGGILYIMYSRVHAIVIREFNNY